MPDTALPYDFSRPPNLSPAELSTLAGAHEDFIRTFSITLSSRARTSFAYELVEISQHTWASYQATLPEPLVLAVVEVRPLGHMLLLEVDPMTATSLVDRLAGGDGSEASTRRLTEMERHSFTTVLGWALQSLQTSLAPLFDAVLAADDSLPAGGDSTAHLELALTSLEHSSELLRFVSPSEVVTAVTYASQTQGARPVKGAFSIIYPETLIGAALAASSPQSENSQTPLSQVQQRKVERSLQAAHVDVAVTLRPQMVPATLLAALHPGDVLELSHRFDRPLLGTVGNVPVFEGFLGRRGRRRALQVSALRAPDEHDTNGDVPPGSDIGTAP